MITLNLPKNQASKINLKNLATFEENYNLYANLFYVRPCFILKMEHNEIIFRTADEFNGWINGAINAIYELPKYRK